MKNSYEAMVIVRSDLTNEELENILSKISKKIEELGGVIDSAAVWARERQFAFPLRSQGAEKKSFDKGCYWLAAFTLDTQKLGDLKKMLKLEENIFRNMIVRKDSK